MAEYIKEKGILVSVISRATGITQNTLYASFSGKRELRADEYLAICAFLEKDPLDFKQTA